jgi:hypothetical protein
LVLLVVFYIGPSVSKARKLILEFLSHWILLSENSFLVVLNPEVLLPQHLLSNHVAGVLSLFCAQAGARMVYAVEASAVANIIPKLAKENNFSEVIKVCGAIINHISIAWLMCTNVSMF